MEETKHLIEGSSHPALLSGSQRLYAMRFCPFAQRALLVAEAKGIKYDVVNVNLVSKPEWFLALNPGGQVPTLEFEDGDMLTESLVVCDYLDDQYQNRPLYPSDARKKGKDRLLIDKFGENTMLTLKLAMGLLNPEKDLKSFQVLLSGFEYFEKELKNRDTIFFGGDKPGMLDYVMWPFFERQSILKATAGDKLDVFDQGRLPTLKRWYDSMMLDGAVKKWFISADHHVRFMKGYATGNKEYDILVK